MLPRSRKVTVLAASIGAPAMLAAVLSVPALTPSLGTTTNVAGTSSSPGPGASTGTPPSTVPTHRGGVAPGGAAGSDATQSPTGQSPTGQSPTGQPAPDGSVTGQPTPDGSVTARGRINLSHTPAARTPKGPLGSPAIQKLLAREVPAGSRQAVLVTGEGETYKQLVALSRWELGPKGWYQSGDATRAHIGAQGWGKQRAGDYRTPVGTYTLTAAGGYLPAPQGTALPYDFRPERYLKQGSRFADYVVRINWNVARSDWDHVPADTPSIDWSRGSGIWLHADSRYDTATAGCVSQPLDGMRRTLQWLDPAANPVIVLAPGPLLVDRPW